MTVKLVSGVMPNGSSLRPKWSRYKRRPFPARRLLPADAALVARIEALQARLAFGRRFAPGFVAVDDRRAHQDDQFALAVGAGLLAEQQAQAGHAADPGQAGPAGRLLLAHQAADGNDAAILDADDAVGLVDAARGERQREDAEIAEIDVLGLLFDDADRGMDVQDDIAALVDLRRDVEGDAGEERL